MEASPVSACGISRLQAIWALNYIIPLLKQAGFLARRGKHEESDELFDLAFSRDPDEPKVWRAAATAWILAKRKSRYPEARKLAERYLATPDRQPNPDPRSELRDLLKKL